MPMKKLLLFAITFLSLSLVATSAFAQSEAEKNADAFYNIVLSAEKDPKYKTKYPREFWISFFDNARQSSKNENLKEACEIVYHRLSESKNQNYETKYEFISVIDGDTIKVKNSDWKEISVRMIWLDTPESNTARYGYTECFWEESTKHLKDLLKNASWLNLEFDETQWELDKYWRTLAYVILNWENINKKMIADWYGWEYTYNLPYKYQSQFKEAQKKASEKKLWLRAENACSGEREKKSTETLNNSSSTSISSSSSSSSSKDSYSSSSNYSSCGSHYWIKWPRGWCYYMNWNKKVYWDHACCK